MTIEAMKQWLDVLEDARDEVSEAVDRAAQLRGYPRTDRRHDALVAQLEKHDEAITSLRAAITQADQAGDDTARLDWLEQAMAESEGNEPVLCTHTGQFIRARDNGLIARGFDTLRAAIDSARGASTTPTQ